MPSLETLWQMLEQAVLSEYPHKRDELATLRIMPLPRELMGRIQAPGAYDYANHTVYYTPEFARSCNAAARGRAALECCFEGLTLLVYAVSYRDTSPLHSACSTGKAGVSTLSIRNGRVSLGRVNLNKVLACLYASDILVKYASDAEHALIADMYQTSPAGLVVELGRSLRALAGDEALRAAFFEGDFWTLSRNLNQALKGTPLSSRKVFQTLEEGGQDALRKLLNRLSRCVIIARAA